MPGRRTSYATYYSRLLGNSAFSLAKGLALPLVRREAVRSGAHAMSYPTLTYAPWYTDEEFQRVHKAVKRNTLVDIWRCYELWSAVGELADVPGALLEVGVWRGGTGAILASRAAALGIDEPVFLCDTWSGVVKTGAVDTYYAGGEHADTSLEVVEKLMERLNLKNVHLLKGVFPDDTGEKVASLDFRLCHIDVDVYRSAKDVFEWVWPRLSSGGVVIFDDYGCAACPGVTKFVDAQRGTAGRLVLHNLNGHGIVIKS